MREVPALFSLCTEAVSTEIIHGDHHLENLFELPPFLFDRLLMCLPPLALHKLQQQTESTSDGFKSGRKRARFGDFNAVWKTLFKSRWPEVVVKFQPVDKLTKQEFASFELTSHSSDWHQMYWESHLQNCLDKAAERALLPSFDGHIGAITIPEYIMKSIGCKRCICDTNCDHSKLSYHCQQFGCYARCLKLQNVLCVAETSDLLRDSKLQSLVLRMIKSKQHVCGVCKLLNQNSGTLSSIEFIYCKFPSTAMNAICNSLYKKSVQTHGIRYFSIKASSILERNPVSLPSGFLSFLSSGRSLCSLNFCDNHLGPNFVKMVFETLVDAASGLFSLDLSDNNIAGWLSDSNGTVSSCCTSSSGIVKSLSSLCMLNLRFSAKERVQFNRIYDMFQSFFTHKKVATIDIRGNNLHKDDADGLKYALVRMPNLKCLDLSDNPIEDEGIMSLISYFVEASERESPLSDVRIDNCSLSCNGMTRLLRILSTLKNPLNSLSIADNDLGSQIAVPLAMFLGESCIRVLNIEDIGLGPSGFLELREQIPKEVKLVDINISKNRGGIETANFVLELVLRAPDLVAIKAGYNFIPSESLPVVCSALKLSKGKLEKLDLTGNIGFYQPDHATKLAEFQFCGRPIVVLPSLLPIAAPYDDDP